MNPRMHGRQGGRIAGIGGLLAVLAGGLAWAATPKEPASPLDFKEFFLPELVISSENVPLASILDALPNREAWNGYLAAQAADQAAVEVYVDPRSGAVTNLIGAFPLIPGPGVGNRLNLEDVGARLGRAVASVDARVVAEATLRFLEEHRPLLGLDLSQLGQPRAVAVTPELWQVSIPQAVRGIPVRHGRLAATIVRGNLVLLGSETWGDVRGLDPRPRIDADEALARGFAHAGGRTLSDELVRPPALEIVPVAPQELLDGEAFAGPAGAGYRHRLVWTFTFERPPDLALWEVMVDAHGGEVIAFEDVQHGAREYVTGGVYPLTNTGFCPTPTTCGAMQSGWPMPFADTGLLSDPSTDSAGGFDYPGGTVTTTLDGIYVRIVDGCGAISNSSTTGSLDLGGVNFQHDCASGGGSPGNTAAARTAFYELNKLAEQARGWLSGSGNPWLLNPVTANVNVNATCGASYNSSTGAILFYRSGNGCANTGEIASIFDHEWAHGLDDNDANGVLSNSAEGYADIAAMYRLQTSCVGYGFFLTDRGCGQTADLTGFNGTEGGLAHCFLNCSGVRESDWDQHADHTPDTALGFVCSVCLTGTGPCGRQVHCASAPARQAAWDLVARDLRSAPFSFDSQTSFLIGNKLFYQGSGNIGVWHACTCGSSSSGCGATNAYMQWLAADDDNGNLADGTPHMTAIFNAFNRHGIACATPTPVNAGCSGGPTGAATLSATSGDAQVALSWTAVPGATRYWVLRTEGVAGCDFGKALIGEVTGTSFVDPQVANGRDYFYNVVAAGASPACFGRASNCATATPAPAMVFFDDFESDQGWIRDPDGTDTATSGLWERGDPEPTSSNGPKQLEALSGSNDLVTGRLAGARPNSNDVDGGLTSIQSPPIALPATGNLTLSFFHYLAHRNNATSADFFRVKVITGTSTTTVFSVAGAGVDRDAAWSQVSLSLNAFAGQTVRLRFEAADNAAESLIEAAVDDVKIVRQ